MKNARKYQWPVIVAAGLHGALFLSAPDNPGLTAGTHFAPPLLPPLPRATIEMVDPDIAVPTNAKVSGGQPVAQLPDLIVSLPADPVFTQALVVVTAPTKINHTLTAPDIAGPRSGPWTGFEDDSQRVFDVRSLDKIPRATIQTSPEFPRGLQIDGARATVTVEFLVNEQGRVVSAHAVRYSHRELIDPAVRAVLRWRFEAGSRSGRPVSFRMAVPIEFSLTNP